MIQSTPLHCGSAYLCSDNTSFRHVPQVSELDQARQQHQAEATRLAAELAKARETVSGHLRVARPTSACSQQAVLGYLNICPAPVGPRQGQGGGEWPFGRCQSGWCPSNSHSMHCISLMSAVACVCGGDTLLLRVDWRCICVHVDQGVQLQGVRLGSRVLQH